MDQHPFSGARGVAWWTAHASPVEKYCDETIADVTWLADIARWEWDMETVNILDARNQLSRLVAAAGAGEDVVIAKRGHPVVRLVAVVDESPRHTAGAAAEWLTRHHPPAHAAPTVSDLDERIEAERQGWV